MNPATATIDGNEAVARVAYKLSEVIAIYPITPASPMGELSDLYHTRGEPNIFGTIPDIMEMQSEAGASGTVHGALQTGALTTTFTASQGLLLMIPNMYKIAGELTPCVFHVASRSIAAQALSIFGDHSDVMAVRQTGFAMLCSASVQEAHDFALIAQAATLESRIPFLHFFDGFRTSHEVNKISLLDDDTLSSMIDPQMLRAHRSRALTPDRPFIRGTSQNPDVYFQGRESVNRYYDAAIGIVESAMEKFHALAGRSYRLFEYVGAPDAERIIILMGSGAQCADESVEYLATQGEKVGVVKMRLYRPFSPSRLIASLPKTVRSIAVLDRTKEPGSLGEPLYLDIVGALSEASMNGQLPFAMPRVIGGRYGLSSKEFTPAMVRAIFDELSKEHPKNRFTIGIIDDLTHTSLEWDESFSLPREGTTEAIFYGLGSDGTVGANKNSIKIIGTETPSYAQGYFVYDSKKSGSMTISHLRFGPSPIRSAYLIGQADFIACHQSVFLEKFDILSHARDGAVFLLNSPFGPNELYDRLPRRVQEQLIGKKIRLFAIDGYRIATENGMGRQINTVMQTCFFAISGILPRDEAIEKIKESIRKSYGKKGESVVQRNFAAVDAALVNLFEVPLPGAPTSSTEMEPLLKGSLSPFVASVSTRLAEGLGDRVPVSQIPEDGSWPSGTSRFEKRNIAHEVPVWDPLSCIQCNKCVLVCPHAVIRTAIVEEASLVTAPQGLMSAGAKGKEFGDTERFILQVSVEDCTGCALCVETCPAKNKSQANLKAINMAPQAPLRDHARREWEFFTSLALIGRERLDHSKVKESQFLEPLFEFSGACPGCGETPYIKLATQLFGDRMIVANATGCSSIYGGNLPTTPWAKNAQGRGPAWSNSLFEDNAEFGLGFRLSIDHHAARARELLKELEKEVGASLCHALLAADQSTEAGIFEQRRRVETLRTRLQTLHDPRGDLLDELADYLCKKSVWIIGGDGWAYDIGYGGVDHILASGRNVNILVLDTQVYSNTGGQQSKATPTGAVAKFAAGGKAQMPKDLAMMALAYENVYVARVAMGASDTQTVRAFVEAERYDGPSIIIAYSHCIAHGYDLRYGMEQQKRAVECGLWPTFRYNPSLAAEGENPMVLDYKGPQIGVKEYMYNETRFSMVEKMDRNSAEAFLETASHHAQQMWQRYQNLEQQWASTPKGEKS